MLSFNRSFILAPKHAKSFNLATLMSLYKMPLKKTSGQGRFYWYYVTEKENKSNKVIQITFCVYINEARKTFLGKSVDLTSKFLRSIINIMLINWSIKGRIDIFLVLKMNSILNYKKCRNSNLVSVISDLPWNTNIYQRVLLFWNPDHQLTLNSFVPLDMSLFVFVHKILDIYEHYGSRLSI